MHASFLPCTLYQCITVSPVQTLINLIPDYYKEIWNVTGTTTYKTNDQGVEYGSTIIPDGIVPFKSLAAQRVEHLILNFSVISLNSLSTEQLSIKGISACIICGSTAETVKDPSSYQVIQSR